MSTLPVVTFLSALLFAIVPARAEEVIAWSASPIGPVVFRGTPTPDGVTSSLRGGVVSSGGVTYPADAAFCSYVASPGDFRQAIMIRSSAVPLAALLPPSDRFLGALFADAAPGTGKIASSIDDGELRSFELSWQSRRTWMIDSRDSLAIALLKGLVAEPGVFSQWDFSQFLVESCTVRVRRVENVYTAEEARSFFPGDGEGDGGDDRGEFVAMIVLEGTMPAAQGMFRWLRTKVSVRVPNFPIRRVNALMR